MFFRNIIPRLNYVDVPLPWSKTIYSNFWCNVETPNKSKKMLLIWIISFWLFPRVFRTYVALPRGGAAVWQGLGQITSQGPFSKNNRTLISPILALVRLQQVFHRRRFLYLYECPFLSTWTHSSFSSTRRTTQQRPSFPVLRTLRHFHRNIRFWQRHHYLTRPCCRRRWGRNKGTRYTPFMNINWTPRQEKQCLTKGLLSLQSYAIKIARLQRCAMWWSNIRDFLRSAKPRLWNIFGPGQIHPRKSLVRGFSGRYRPVTAK